jgi:succinyl-CoA synthetase beta subunit
VGIYKKMNLHEFQAKRLFTSYGIPVPEGHIVTSVAEAREVSRLPNEGGWVVKAQVHSGGRGKAGGVKQLSEVPGELENTARELLGTRLVTNQTGTAGLPVDKLLVEVSCNIARELYLGALVDRSRSQLVFMASSMGGMRIQKRSFRYQLIQLQDFSPINAARLLLVLN